MELQHRIQNIAHNQRDDVHALLSWLTKLIIQFTLDTYPGVSAMDLWSSLFGDRALIARCVKVLSDAGYTGYISTEYEAGGDPVGETLKLLEDVVSALY